MYLVRVLYSFNDCFLFLNMAKVVYSTSILKANLPGHQANWTYIIIPAELVQKIKPGHKKEFKVKGSLDKHKLTRVSVMPMGGGDFILPLNADMRKAIGKRHGAMLQVTLEEDKSEFIFNADFMECLTDDPSAKAHFESLPGSHQRYFSKWIDSAKTESTKVKRITMAVNALSKKWGYPEMIRHSQGKTI